MLLVHSILFKTTNQTKLNHIQQFGLFDNLKKVLRFELVEKIMVDCLGLVFNPTQNHKP
uniref:Uncharacterized protein n=1 Tax=Rhizophora mucronata TaxID=61149 RepID=A0A2P2R157_RHIMU